MLKEKIYLENRGEIMTEIEAVKDIKENILPLVGGESLVLAINALEKQIKKKPIMKPYFDDIEEEYLCCPTCGEILTDRIPMDNKDFYFHCLNCGQKLDFGE